MRECGLKMAKKKTKSGQNNRTSPTYNRIISLYLSGVSPEEIPDELDKDPSCKSLKRTSVYDTIKRYKETGQKFRTSPGHRMEFEIHDYCLSFPIKSNKKIKTSFILKKKHIPFEIINRNTWKAVYFKRFDCSIHVTPKSVLLYPPKIESKISPTLAVQIADQIALSVLPRIEKLLEIKLSCQAWHYITICTQHVAIHHKELFELLNDFGVQKVVDEKRRTRIILDRSKGKRHVEGIDPHLAQDDIEKIRQFILHLIDSDISLRLLTKLVLVNQEAILRLMRPEGFYNDEVGRDPPPNYVG